MATSVYFQLSSYYGKNTYFVMMEKAQRFNIEVKELNNGWFAVSENDFATLYNTNAVVGGCTSKPVSASATEEVKTTSTKFASVMAWIPALLIGLLGLLLIALGIYELATATSNIDTFRIVGIAPLIIGLMLLVIAPTTKD